VIFQYPKSGSGAVRRPVAFPPRPVRIRKQCKFCIAELDAGGSVISVPPKPSEVALKFAAVYRPGPTDIAARLIGQWLSEHLARIIQLIDPSVAQTGVLA
jgi:hypothetical protein